MRYLGLLVGTVGTVMLAAPHVAGAATAPLLVVVESTDRAGPDAEAVRKAIGAELGTPVLAPGTADAATQSDLLIVAVERSGIRMSLRTSTSAAVTRAIEASPDRVARLREIGWLAGNLARDQVSPLVALEAPRERPITSEGATPPLPSPLVEPPPMAAWTSTEDSPRAVPFESAQAPVAVASVRERSPTNSAAVWSVTAAGGPTLSLDHMGAGILDNDLNRGATYQIEVARQAAGGLILGSALEFGSTDPRVSISPFGLAAFMGTGDRGRRWFWETTAGLGLELARVLEPQTTIGPTSTVVQYQSALRPVPYLRGTAGIGVAVSSNLDLLVRATVHVVAAGLSADFAGATVGLRFRLP